MSILPRWERWRIVAVFSDGWKDFVGYPAFEFSSFRLKL